MKKWLISLLILNNFIHAQEEKVLRDKAQFANHAVLIGSTVVLAAGCLVTKKHWSKVAWVTKDRFVCELTKMAASIRQDILESKCALVKEIKAIDRNLSDIEMRINGKFSAHDSKLAEIKSSLDSMHQKIDMQQADLQEILRCLRNKN